MGSVVLLLGQPRSAPWETRQTRLLDLPRWPCLSILVAVVTSAGSLHLCGFMPSKHTLCPPRWASGGWVTNLCPVCHDMLFGPGALPCLFSSDVRASPTVCPLDNSDGGDPSCTDCRTGPRLCLHFMQPPGKWASAPSVYIRRRGPTGPPGPPTC